MTKRTILLTGGSGKFGKSLVAYFLAAGDRVITTCRSAKSLEEMNSLYAKYQDNFIGFQCDLTGDNASAILAEKIADTGVRPDCLINNARSLEFLRMDDAGMVSRENFAGELLLDVIVPYELTMALAGQEGGRLRRVVNIGSQYGTVAANLKLYSDPLKQSPLHYSVAKAALAHLTRELAVRLADAGVQVNCIAFGGVEGRVDDAFKKRYAQLCPMGRMLTDQEVVGPVDMLLSEHFSGMTGHVLAVDGGWGIW